MFKTKKEAIEHCITTMKMTQEDAEAHVEKNFGDLPDVIPMNVVPLDEVEERMDATDKRIDDLTTAQETLVSDQKAFLKEHSDALRKGNIDFKNDNDNVKNGGYQTFAEYCVDIARAARSPERKPEKLVKWLETHERMQKELSTKAISGAGLQETLGADGGFIVPPEHSNRLFINAIETSQIVNMTEKIPMASNTITFPAVQDSDHSGDTIFGGVALNWEAESTSASVTKPSFGKIQLTLNKLLALINITSEMLEDSPISIEPLITSMFAQALQFELEKVVIRGTGAGQPMGYISAPCTVSVAKETGQAAATIKVQNVINMYRDGWRKQNMVWVCNNEIIPELFTMTLKKDGTNDTPVYLPAGSYANQPNDTLFGRPIIWTEHASALGTVGDIALCDFSQYLIGQKTTGGLQVDTSVHLRFDYDESVMKFRFRIDGKPWWSSAQTPAQGSNTISPFVTLATRS